MNIEELFFELLQVAVGNRGSLSRVPTAREWGEIYNEATRQALTGVCFVALQGLSNDNNATANLPELLRLKWLGMAAKIQQKNQKLNAECAEVCKTLAHDGIRSVVVKGQSNLVYYPDELKMMRTAGDIDLWSLPYDEGVPIAVASGGTAEYVNYRGVAGIVEYARLQKRIKGDADIPWHRVLYYHVEMDHEGTEVELHYRPSYLNSPLRNYRLQRWFKENEQFGLEDAKIDGNVFPVATVGFNAVYQLLHMFKHLFDGGVGLRQLMDYYFVLRSLHTEQGSLEDRTQSMAQWAEGMGISVPSNKELVNNLDRFGLKKFASAVMYVLQEVFAMPDAYLLCVPNEKEGRFLLNEVMMAGNFGKYDDRLEHKSSTMGHAWEKLTRNMRFLTHYPEEVIWEPFFRVYHWIWRRLELWRF